MSCSSETANFKKVNILFGPSEQIEDLSEMMTQFFAEQGVHIVSGGTTSNLAAEFLGKDLVTSIDYIDSEVPPTAKIEGVDIVTEGVFTVNKVLEYAKDLNAEKLLLHKWQSGRDGASQIARMLFDEATHINFYVGKAINPAHQNSDFPIDFNTKMQLVAELCENLKIMGKTVKVSYF